MFLDKPFKEMNDDFFFFFGGGGGGEPITRISTVVNFERASERPKACPCFEWTCLLSTIRPAIIV